MGSNVKIGTNYINGADMTAEIDGAWIDSFENQRFSFAPYWTGTPTGTLYIDVANGTSPTNINSLMNLTTPVVVKYDFISSVVVTSGLTPTSLASYFVAGQNDFNYIRVRWVPSGGTAAGSLYCTGCLKAQK